MDARARVPIFLQITKLRGSRQALDVLLGSLQTNKTLTSLVVVGPIHPWVMQVHNLLQRVPCELTRLAYKLTRVACLKTSLWTTLTSCRKRPLGTHGTTSYTCPSPQRACRYYSAHWAPGESANAEISCEPIWQSYGPTGNTHRAWFVQCQPGTSFKIWQNCHSGIQN